MDTGESFSLPFGRRVVCGGFYVLKRVRALGKAELRRMRDDAGIPPEVRRGLPRRGLPYITVGTVSGSWTAEFVYGMRAYSFLDGVPVVADGAGLVYGEDDGRLVGSYVNMLFFDACVPLSPGCYLAKALAMSALAECMGHAGGRAEIPEGRRAELVARIDRARDLLVEFVDGAAREAAEPEPAGERAAVEGDVDGILAAGEAGRAIAGLGAEILGGG